MTSKSLSEQLADLTNPVPTLCDPEDDIYEETRARVSERETGLSSGEEEGPAPSQLRKQAAALLSDQDPRYAGKTVSRTSLQVDSDRDDSLEEGDDSAAGDSDEEESAAEEEEEQQLEAFKAKLNGVAAGSNGLSASDEAETDSEEAATTPHGSSAAESASGDDDDEDEDGDADENGVTGDEDATDEDGEEASEDGMSEEEEEAGGMQLTSQSGGSDAEKGTSVQAQLGIWDQLLECRIKLQPCVQLCNQLPAAASWQPFWEAAGDDAAAQLSAATAAADKLAQQLLHLQAALLSQFPETSRLEAAPPSDKHPETADHLDEDDDAAEHPAAVSSRKRRRRGGHSADDQAAKRFAAYRPYRDSTIQRWNDKTRLTAGRVPGAGKAAAFAAFEQSTVRQIEQILSDRERLVRRTRLRRSDTLPLGRPAAPAPAPTGDGGDDSEVPQVPTSAEDNKDYDDEIFDDSDFYHQLLRELIERKTVDVTDPLSLGKQWIQIQKLRSKMKKRVDTRASKGRKVRYEVYPKLVSFMASRRVPGAMSDAARDELFSSLFGRRHQLEVAAAGADAA